MNQVKVKISKAVKTFFYSSKYRLSFLCPEGYILQEDKNGENCSAER